MVNGNSTASVLRAVERPVTRAPDANASRIADAQNAGQSFRAGLRRRRASGIFRSTDEFAGLERLDRAELDETDED
jgi:hypothetical protein